MTFRSILKESKIISLVLILLLVAVTAQSNFVVRGTQSSVDTGNYLCAIDGSLSSAQFTLPTGESLSSNLLGFFEANLNESSGTAGLYDLDMYADSVEVLGSPTGLIFFEIDFGQSASGSLKSDSSGELSDVEIPFNLNVTIANDPVGTPIELMATLSGSLSQTDDSFSGTLAGTLPRETPFLSGAELLLDLNCVQAGGSGRVVEDSDESDLDGPITGGLDETFVLPPDEEFLENVRRQEPDPELFEFIGMVDFLTEEEYQSDIAAQQAAFANMTRSEMDRLFALDEDDNEPALIVMVSADGRMYRERPGVRARRELTGTQPETGVGAPPTRSASGLAHNVPDPTGFSPRAIKGSDGRKLTTTASYHARAVGVALRPNAGSTQISCSAAMVSHRIVMTAAHCVTTNGNNLKTRVAAPGARGEQWNGDNSPFGDRRIEWYSWASNFNGSTAYPSRDYAALVLEDIPWSPGYVYFRSKSLTYLDWRTHFAHGYPGNNHQCADSPLNDGRCGGYRYSQSEQVSTVFGKYFYHQFDAETGQSGTGIYDLDNGNRYIHGIHVLQSACCWNIAHRLHSDSIDHFCWWVENRPSSYFGGNPKCN